MQAKRIECPYIGFRMGSLSNVQDIHFTEREMIVEMHFSGIAAAKCNRKLSILPNTFAECFASKTKFPLLRSEGISILPEQTEYRRKKARCYKLYFPLPSEGTEFINIIFAEGQSEWQYLLNVYYICLTEAARKKMKHHYERINSAEEIAEHFK